MKKVGFNRPERNGGSGGFNFAECIERNNANSDKDRHRSQRQRREIELRTASGFAAFDLAADHRYDRTGRRFPLQAAGHLIAFACFLH